MRPLLPRPKPHAPKGSRQAVRGPRGLHSRSLVPCADDVHRSAGEIEHDESTDGRRVVLTRSSRAATLRGNGSRGAVSWSIVASDQLNDKRNTTSSHRGDYIDATTGGTVGATTGTTPRCCHVRDENGDDDTHLNRGFGHDTTHDATRSDRRGSNERGGGRTEVERACVHAHARFS